MEAWLAAVAILLGYLLGSIPSAYILVRLVKGTDIRTVGTGNVGALNTYQQLGTVPAVAVMAVDVGKGVVAVFLPAWLARPGLGQIRMRLQLRGGAHLAGFPQVSRWQRGRHNSGCGTGPGSHPRSGLHPARNYLRLGHQERSHWSGIGVRPVQRPHHYPFSHHRGALMGRYGSMPGPYRHGSGELYRQISPTNGRGHSPAALAQRGLLGLKMSVL